MHEMALYIHVPFCRHKCIYCDFFSITDVALLSPYLTALEQEIEYYMHNPPFDGFTVSTVYFGGGTPSLVNTPHISSILQHIRRGFQIVSDAETTFETNPATLMKHSYKNLLHAGINRLSLGIQSFNDDELKTLTRIHDAQDAETSMVQARKAGISNMSVDLIFAIPGQTLDSWRASLHKTTSLAPQHVSMYGLTYETGTALTKALKNGKISKCDEELEREMYLCGKEILEAAGFEHYEISNFAQPGFRSHHNQKYWDGTPYLGLGPSAHSYMDKVRWNNIEDVQNYCSALTNNKLPLANREDLTPAQIKAEKLMLGLRRKQGIDLTQWRTTFNEDLNFAAIKSFGSYDHETPSFLSSPSGKLLTNNKDHLALTQQGLLLYDFICKEIYSGIS